MYSGADCSKFKAIGENAAISTRYLSIPDFTPEASQESALFQGADGYTVPLERRLERGFNIGSAMAPEVCRRALDTAGVAVGDIGKLVVASSTVFQAPGMESIIASSLELRPDVDVAPCHYGGCSGGCAGLRIACEYVKATPGECALLFCIDLSSPHINFAPGVNSMILHAIFADGCAAVVLRGYKKQAIPPNSLAVLGTFSWRVEGSEDGIVLDMGANGISCTLSKSLPRYLEKGIGPIVGGALANRGLKKSDVKHWAIHPGGRKILEAVEKGVQLCRAEMACSWEVLRDYGNMLGTTIFFVLEKIMKRALEARGPGSQEAEMGVGFSFAPGVRTEGFLFQITGGQ
eukprot:evm.model.scf_380EXC.4 EVM.evm.TU.scf_380EXC.4   scf_380EXC:36558-40212(-)